MGKPAVQDPNPSHGSAQDDPCPWPFPPCTREVQLDEKWAFVQKKQRNCDPTDPDDDHRGDDWDHVAFDPEHKLVLVVVPRARTEKNARVIVAEVGRRVNCDPPPMMTSDEYPTNATAIEEVFSVPAPTPPRRKPGRTSVVPERRLPRDVLYVTARRHREDGRVIAVEQRQVFGTPEGLEGVLGGATASHRGNTPCVGRQDATDRGRNARKGERGRRTASARTGRSTRR